ncbi:MAG: hypothetical protein QW371_03230 [Candidatus Bathyarchaeia archaeon]
MLHRREGERAIEDYFTPDGDYVAKLRERGSMAAEVLERFYEGLGRATLIYVNQPEPRGFGDAVLRAKLFAGGGEVLGPRGGYLHPV